MSVSSCINHWKLSLEQSSNVVIAFFRRCFGGWADWRPIEIVYYSSKQFLEAHAGSVSINSAPRLWLLWCTSIILWMPGEMASDRNHTVSTVRGWAHAGSAPAILAILSSFSTNSYTTWRGFVREKLHPLGLASSSLFQWRGVQRRLSPGREKDLTRWHQHRSLSAPQAFFDFFWLVPWQLAKCFCRRERATPGWRSFCSAQALRRPQQGPSSKTVSKYMLWCNLPFDVSCAVLYFLKLSTISIY